MSKSKTGSALLLLGASFIWGIAFVAQTTGMTYIGPFTFSAVRTLIAALTLVPCFRMFDRLGLTPQQADKKQTVKAGLILGVILFVAANLQQIGLLYTTVAKAGFITSLYIVLVPIAGMLLLKKKVHQVIWVCVPIAMVGLYFLSIHQNFTMGKGDLLVLACAVAFTSQILVIDHFAAKVDVVRMSCLMFFVTSALTAILMFLFEKPVLSQIAAAWWPLLYAGALSGGCAYTMQMLGQRNIEPAAASLLLSPEAMFAALAGWVLLGQTLTDREILGCTLVFAAIILSQIPWKTKQSAVPLRSDRPQR
ncbi:MAG: DMT family transporter [Clostridia bacterium]